MCVGTDIEATSTNAEPIQLGMVETVLGMESLLDTTSTYCGELLGVDQVGAPRHVLEGVSASDMDLVAQDYVVAPARTYLHFYFDRVIPRCPLCFQV